MKKCISLLLAAIFTTGFLFATAQSANAGLFSSAAEKRERVDLNARHSLERLFASDEKAQRLYDRARGYAVFSITKGALILTGGGGTGVAVHKSTEQRTYMHVGMGGIGLGIGGQAFRMVILFEDENTFEDFIDNGWHASSSANAVAGRNGVNAEASFTNGLAVYQLTDAGLLLQADIGGAHYWRSKRLNNADALMRTAEVDSAYAPATYSTSSSETVEYHYGSEPTKVYPLETTSYETTSYYESETVTEYPAN